MQKDSEKLTYQFLTEEAKKQGYTVELLWAEEEAPFIVTKITDPKTGRHLLVTKSARYPHHSLQAFSIAQDKFLTQHLLKDTGLHFAQTQAHDQVQNLKEALKEAFATAPKWVLKPRNGMLGEGVHILEDLQEALKVAEAIIPEHKQVLLQSYQAGEDLRIQAVGGQLFAACKRVPANVTGDGSSTLQKLIDTKNASKHADNQIHDYDHLDLNKVPSQGETIQIHDVCSLSFGGDAVDVTDQLHADYARAIAQIAQILSTESFALDVICNQPELPFKEGKPILLEVNVPCMWGHHHFALGQKRNVAFALLDAHFNKKAFDPKNQKYLIV